MVTVDIEDGPCGWVIDPAEAGCCDAWEEYSEQQQEAGAVLAAAWMWAATGRQYGQCEVTVQLCAQRHRMPTYRAAPATGAGYPGPWAPYLLDGVWWNAPSGGGLCCSARCELHLPGIVYNTDAIVEVLVAGEAIDPGSYLVFDRESLVRVDGQCWPVCCNATAEDTAIQVTYLDGIPVPADVVMAANVLACEFAAACAGGECRLPRQIARMTQFGTTIDFATLPGPGTPVMAVGIDEVDQVVHARNPWGMAMPVGIVNPNRPRPRRLT